MSFTQQQLEEAYNQMGQARAEDARYAKLAAEALQAAINKFQPVTAKPSFTVSGITPFEHQYVLTIALNQHDDWDGCIAKLTAAGVQLEPWGRSVYAGPGGTYDVSNDEQFAERSRKSYRVKIDYYDGGY